MRTFSPLVFVLLMLAPGVSTVRSQPELPLSRDSLLAAAREIMGLQKYCALITVDSVGHPHARTMNPFPPEADMAVWFATNSRSRKVREIRDNPAVCLYYADHKEARGYVAITGRAVLVDDTAEKMKRKRDYWEQAFPDWKYLVLIKVIPEHLDVLNYARGGRNDPTSWKVPSVEFDHR
jgi:general stress protein 26